MESKFIYIFDKMIADSLVVQGFNIVKKDDEKKIYVFENTPNITMSFSKNDFAFSNMLTF